LRSPRSISQPPERAAASMVVPRATSRRTLMRSPSTTMSIGERQLPSAAGRAGSG
jgi:hypothetical protein